MNPVRKTTLTAGLALAVPIATLGLATPARAAVTNGDVAYTETTEGEGSDIYTSRPDGTNRKQLTDTGAEGFSNEHPQWSPDGQQIAYNTNQDGNSEIYKMNADGSGKLNLSNHPDADLSPDWSPDGTQIAFVSDRDGNFEIYKMNADGSAPVRLTDNTENDAAPLWSPNGTRILFQHAGSEIWIMSADGSNQFFTDLFGIATDWSPDGSTFLAILSEDGQLYSVNAMTLQPVLQLTDGGTPFWASYSPDGTKIVYTYSPVEPNVTSEGIGAQNLLMLQVYVMNADGSNKTFITNNDFDHLFTSWQPLVTVTPPDTPAQGSVAAGPERVARADELPRAGLDSAVYMLTLGLLFGAGALGRRRLHTLFFRARP